MRKKIFSPSAIGGATALISITSLLSYAIGIVRDRIIAVNFGTSNLTDNYNASFLIPDMLFNLFIAGALSAAFLPVFAHYLTKDKEEAYKIANSVLNGAMILIISLSTLAFIFMPQIVPFFFFKIDPAMHDSIINMTRIMLVSSILFAISNTLGNVLMGFRHFFSYAISPILYNLGIILGVIFLRESFGIYSAAAGVLIGASFHCLVRIIDTFTTDYKYRAEIDTKHPGFRKIIRLMIPKSIGLIAWQINLYLFAIVGMRTVEGGLAAFNFARNIQSFAVSLFGIAFATAVFPFLSNTVSVNDEQGYTDHIQKTIQRILFFTIPSAVGLMILSTEMVDLILSGGEFDQNSLNLTAPLLFFFAISIPFESLSHILARAFYARQNTMTPTIINVLAAVIIGLITIFVAPKYGIQWFSIGFSIGFAIYVLILVILLSKYLKGFKPKLLISSVGKTMIASSVMAVAIYLALMLDGTMPEKLLHLVRVCIGGLIFFLMAFILKSPELSSVKYVLDRVFKKKTYEKNPS